MEISRKLVRGLKDISPLFSDLQKPEILPPKGDLELRIFSVTRPQFHGDSLFLNGFFAAQLENSGRPCSLVTLSSYCETDHSSNLSSKSSEPFGSHLRRHWLYWDEMCGFFEASSLPRGDASVKDRDIFLDFEYSQLSHFEGTVCLLDKWILLLQPNIDSLTEGYRLMKAAMVFNPQLEFYVAFEGLPQEDFSDAFLYERFAGFVSKQLGIHLGWLGWLCLSNPEGCLSNRLDLNQLLEEGKGKRISLEKVALASWIESAEEELLCEARLREE